MVKETAAKTVNRDLNFIMTYLRTSDALNRYLELQLARWHTSPIRFAVMNAIVVHGGEMTPTDIGKWTYRTPRTVTSMLDSLERDGLIRREPNPNDRRSIRVVVTDHGWEDTRKMVPRTQVMSRKALSILTEEEIDTIRTILKKWRKHIFAEIEQTEVKKGKRPSRSNGAGGA